jgi:hypothetical protein
VHFDEAGSRSSATSVWGSDATNIQDGKALFGFLYLNNRETVGIDSTQKHRET